MPGGRGHLTTDEGHLESLAEWWRDTTGADTPVDGVEELRVAGLRVIADGHRARGRACLDGDVVWYRPGLPDDVLNEALLHELGHVLAMRERCDSEAAATYIGAAVAMPRREVRAAVRRVGRDIPAVRRAFGSSVPHETVARRLVDVDHELVLSVWWDGRMRRRHARGELAGDLRRRASDLERRAMERAVAGEHGWSDEERVGAWVVEERRARRTYVLAEIARSAAQTFRGFPRPVAP